MAQGPNTVGAFDDAGSDGRIAVCNPSSVRSDVMKRGASHGARLIDSDARRTVDRCGEAL